MSTFKFIKENCSWIFSGIGIAITNGIYHYFKDSKSNLIISLFFSLLIIFSTIIIIDIYLFLKKRGIGEYIYNKIREFLHFLLGDKKTYILSKYKYDCYETHESYKNLILLIKQSACDNQGIFANYFYSGGKLHKEIKTENTRINNKGLEGETGKELEKHCNNLEKYLNEGLIKAIKINERHLLLYFKNRSKTPPRVVVKAFNNEKIVDVYRNQPKYYTEYGVEENTGFDHVHNTGQYFICNDIPSEAAKDEYFNPRLINKHVRAYLEQVNRNNGKHDQSRWIDCWVPQLSSSDQKSFKPSPDSCYKSTLIVPMTLLNNEGLSDDFCVHFKIPRVHSDTDIGRAVYGFLCFDHTDVNYFQDPLDIKVGYIFADLLSLFFIEHLNYTQYSTTFQEAQEKLLLFSQT